MNDKQKKKWATTRAKGQNRFLLIFGLPLALGVTLSALTRFIFVHGFSLQTFSNVEFWIEVGMSFVTSYGFASFIAIHKWRTNEHNFMFETNNQKSVVN